MFMVAIRRGARLGLLHAAVLDLLLAELCLMLRQKGTGTCFLGSVWRGSSRGDELLAPGAAAVGLALTALGVLHHPLHLLAGRQ